MSEISLKIENTNTFQSGLASLWARDVKTIEITQNDFLYLVIRVSPIAPKSLGFTDFFWNKIKMRLSLFCKFHQFVRKGRRAGLSPWEPDKRLPFCLAFCSISLAWSKLIITVLILLVRPGGHLRKKQHEMKYCWLWKGWSLTPYFAICLPSQEVTGLGFKTAVRDARSRPTISYGFESCKTS